MKRLLLILVVFLCGCATYQGQTSWDSHQRETITTKIFDYSYNKVFNATLEAFEGGGYSIQTADKESGIINTGFKSLSDAFGTKKIKLYARIKEITETQAKVKINIHVEGYSDVFGVSIADNVIGEGHYRKVFLEIVMRLK